MNILRRHQIARIEKGCVINTLVFETRKTHFISFGFEYKKFEDSIMGIVNHKINRNFRIVLEYWLY